MKTVYLILTILLVFLLVQCKKEVSTPNVTLQYPLQNIVDSLLEGKSYNNIELYINKIHATYYVILLYGGKSPMSEQSTLWQTQVDGKSIAVYSGIENFLKIPYEKKRSNNEHSIMQGDFWLIKLMAMKPNRELLLRANVQKVNSQVRSPFKAVLPFLTPEELTIDYAAHMVDSLLPYPPH